MAEQGHYQTYLDESRLGGWTWSCVCRATGSASTREDADQAFVRHAANLSLLTGLQAAVDRARAVRAAAPTSVPERDGYDWLLNRCVDIDQADHAEHLDSGHYVQSCFHCQNGEGRPTPVPGGVAARKQEADRG